MGPPILWVQLYISNQQLPDLKHTVSDTNLAKTQYGAAVVMPDHCY